MLPFDSLDRVSAKADVQSPETINVDLPVLATAVGQRLHEADMPVSPAQSEQYARALQLTKPRSRAALYYTTRAIFLTDLEQLETFNRVYAEIFGPSRTTHAEESGVAPERAPTPVYI